MPELHEDDVIEVPDGAWAFGTGVLRLRVRALGPYVPVPNTPGQWRQVEGIELDSAGAPRSPVARTATVDVSRVRRRNGRG